MKGSPLFEWFVALIAMLACFFPLQRLTQPPNRPSARQNTSLPNHLHSNNDQSVYRGWLEVRSSHPPETIQLFQNQVLLWEGKALLEQDADLNIGISEARSELELIFRWSEDVQQAYVELTLEVGMYPQKKWSGWSSGVTKKTWRLDWEPAS